MAEVSQQTRRGPKKLSEEHQRKLQQGRERKRLEKEQAAAAAKAAAKAEEEARARGEIVDAPPDLSTPGARPRSLLDIFNLFPIGDGSHYIQVNRTRPTNFYGHNCGGVQQQIRGPMTESEYATFYGGGTYELRVYQQVEGPGGMPRHKPLTDPILYTIPGQPNLDSVMTTEEEDMRTYGANGNRRMVGAERVASHEPPQVSIARMGHSERVMDKDEQREERQRQLDERRRREAEEAERRSADVLVERGEREIERLERQKDRELELAREAADARTEAQVARVSAEARQSGVDPLEAIERAARLLRPNEAATSQQMQQMLESNKAEVARMHSEHEKSLKAERDRADTRIKDAEDRADKRIRDAESRAEQRIKDDADKFQQRQRDLEDGANRRVSEIEQRAEARVREEQRRADERIRDLTVQYDNRIKDLERNHERELRAKESEGSMTKSQVETQLNARIATLESDLRRATTDAERYRQEREDYKKQSEDWIGQMQKFEERAEALGFSKDTGEGGDAPQDWKQVAAQVGMQFVQGIPDALKSGAEALSKLRAGGDNPEVVRAMHERRMLVGAQSTVPHTLAGAQQFGAPPAQQSLPFATEDGISMVAAPPPVPRPPIAPPTTTAPPNQQPAPPPPPPMQQAPLQPQAMVAYEAQQQQPEQQPAEPPQAGPGDDQFDMVVQILAHHCENKTPTIEVAHHFLSGIPKEHWPALRAVSIDQITEFLKTRPYDAAQKLRRREGARYLKEVWAAVQTELSK